MVTKEDFQIKENVRLMYARKKRKVCGTPFVRYGCLKDVLETFCFCLFVKVYVKAGDHNLHPHSTQKSHI